MVYSVGSIGAADRERRRRMKRSPGWALVVAGGVFLSLNPVRAQQANDAPAKPPQKPSLPNAVPAQATLSAEWRDPALNTLVNVVSSGQTVQELLQAMNAPERPTLQAQEPVGWQHVTVYAHQQPVEKIMTGLKTLFNGVWGHNVSDPAQVRYVLKSTGRAQEYDKELYRLTLERGAEPMLRLMEYLKAPIEEYARLNDKYWKDHIELKDPLLRENLGSLASRGGRNGLEFLTTLSPEQRFALLSEGTYFIPMSVMTEQQRRLTHQMGLETGRVKAKLGKMEDGETQEDSTIIGDRFGLMLTSRVHPVTGAFLGFGISTGVGGGGGGGAEEMPPPAPLLAVRGNPYHYSPGSKIKLPVYPDLQQKPFPGEFKLEKGREYAWHDVLAELAKYVSLPIYSDDFGYTTVPQDRLYGDVYTDVGTRRHLLAERPKLTSLKLPEALDVLCSQYGYLWWYQDGTLFFRSRTWFIEQLYEVPPPVLALVRHQIETEGNLNVAGLTALSGLTKKQLVGLSVTNLTYGPGEVSRRTEVGGRQYDREVREFQRADTELAWEGLQVFALLNEEQKTKVLLPEGLLFAEMPYAAQQGMFHALYTRQSIALLNQPEEVHLRAYQRMTPPERPDGPRLANLGLSLSKVIGFGAEVAIRVTPAAPKINDKKSPDELKH
jgi:hypothetical protein